MTHIVANLTQHAFRFRNDDGSEAAATWIAAENTSISLGTTVFRLRIRFRETAGATTAVAITSPLQFSRNGGAYTDITTASDFVRAVASGSVTDGAATTEQLTGPGTFVAGSIDSNGTWSTPILSNQDTEMEFVLQLVGVENGDTLDFQASGLNDYVQTPRITAVVAISGATSLSGAGSISASATVTSLPETFAGAASLTGAGTVTAAGDFPLPTGSYESVVLADNPVAFWPLQDDGLDIAGSNDLTISGSATFGEEAGDVVTKYLDLLGISSSTQRAETDSTNLNLPGPLTYECWARIALNWGTATTTQGLQIMALNDRVGLRRFDNSLTDMGSSLRDDSGVDIGGTGWGLITTPPQEEFCHLVMVYDRTARRQEVWINGVLEAFFDPTTDEDAATNVTQPFSIGYQRDTAGTARRFFEGRVAYAAVYDSALTEAQIQNHYNTMVSGDLSGAASLSGTGSISADGTIFGAAIEGSASLSGTGTIAASGLRTTIGSTTLNGTGTIAASGAVISAAISGASSLNGAGSITVDGRRAASGQSDLSGAGLIAASGTRSTSGQSTLAGAGSLDAASTLTLLGAASLDGAGSISADGAVIGADIEGAASLTGIGSIIASGAVNRTGSATLTGAGDVAAQASRTTTASADLQGTGDVEASGQRIAKGATELTGAGDLDASATLTVSGAASLQGVGTVNADGLIIGAAIPGAASLSGAGNVTASAARTTSGAAALAGAGSITADATRTASGAISLSGDGSITAAATRSTSGNVSLAGVGSLGANGTVLAVSASGAAVLVGIGTLSATASSGISVAANLNGAGSLTAVARIKRGWRDTDQPVTAWADTDAPATEWQDVDAPATEWVDVA